MILVDPTLICSKSSISFQGVIIANFLLPITENPAQKISNAWGQMTRAFHVQKVRLDNQTNSAIPLLEYLYHEDLYRII